MPAPRPSLRERLNRNDGRWFQVDNRHIRTTEAVGLVLFALSLALWQFHEKAGLDAVWAWGCGSLGLTLAWLGALAQRRHGRSTTDAAEHEH